MSDAASEDPRQLVPELLSQALSMQNRIGSLHAQLASTLGPQPDAETELKQLISSRETLIQKVGLASLQWAMQGGHITLHGAEGGAGDGIAAGVAADHVGSVTFQSPTRRTAAYTALPLPPMRENIPVLAEAEARVLLSRMIDRIGPPFDVGTPSAYGMEVTRVAGGADSMDDWLQLEQNAQRDLLAFLVSKARYLQDESDPTLHQPTPADKLRRAFPRLTAWSRIERPGYVHGLTRRHDPEPAETWFDSMTHWHRLLCRRAGRDEVDDSTSESRNAALMDELREVLNGSPRAVLLRKGFVDAVIGGVRSDDDELVELAIPFYATLQSDPRLSELRRAIRVVEDMDDETAEVLREAAAEGS